MRLAELIFGHVRKSQKDGWNKRSHYIFYKIVDSISEEKWLLQCINTKATFISKITDIVLDSAILHGLHPIQSCYIGIEYSKFLKKTHRSSKIQQKYTENFINYPISRYGCYSIRYQNRKGEVCFINKKTLEEVLMDPRDIALSEELIDEFDAAEAFYIGLVAGIKLHNPIAHSEAKQIPHLKIVK